MKKDRPLILFDMDGVLVHERSSWRLVHDAIGTFNEASFELYMRGEIDDLEFMRRDIRMWMDRGLTRVEDVERILRSATLMNGFGECMSGLIDAGAETVIISGGLDLLACRLAVMGGFAGYVANGLNTRDDGTLTGEGVLRVPLIDKGSVVRRMIGEDTVHGPVVAVGDSVVDISMFRAADLSIAFRPENREVETAADFVVQAPDLTKVLDIIAHRT
ncbi:MAG: HAD-IB family phosphatase [Candidatus Thermoplasmatota archaeon]|nr:HAD-IB family phosphatase [Candidatus Thermoplasmatota archaeon]